MRGQFLVGKVWRSREPLVLTTLAVGSTLVLIVMNSTPLGTEFGFVLKSMSSLLLIWAVVGIRCAILFVRFTRDRSWRRSFAPGFLLAVAILIGFNFFPFIRGCNYLGGALRVAANQSYYDHQVALLR